MIMATNPIEVQKYLAGVEYPADRQTLIDHAQQEGAPQEVIDMLTMLPEEEFESAADVSAGLGGQQGSSIDNEEDEEEEEEESDEE